MKKITVVITTMALFTFLMIWDFTPHVAAKKGSNSEDATGNVKSEQLKTANSMEDEDSPFVPEQQQQGPSKKKETAQKLESTPISGDGDGEEGEDPDLPSFAQGKVDKEDYMRRRDEYIGLLRGVQKGKPFDPFARGRAIKMMESQQKAKRLAAEKNALPGMTPNAGPVWTPMGPSPIPNGQTQTTATPVSGRTTALVVDPTNSLKVYLGTAQGGVWRSLDGGLNWTPIFDSAQTQAIGALALAPSSPTTLYVGTGEANGSCDSYNGVGLYRIDNADTTATLVGPINPVRNYIDVDGVTPRAVAIFTGRSISKIVVHPTQPGTVFVGTAGANVSLGCDAPFSGTVPPLGLRGLYRSFNANAATAGAVTFERIKVSVSNACFDTPCTGNRNITDIVQDPNNLNNLVVWQNGINVAGDGGIWRSTNALDPTATNVIFTQTFITTATSTSNAKGAFSSFVSGGNLVIYEGSGEPSTGTSCGTAAQLGAVRVSVDGGVTWSTKLAGSGGFCGTQCFYNVALAALPGPTAAQTDDEVHIGGNTQSATCNRLHARSNDGGATFTNFANGLHADSHLLVTDPITPTIIYHGSDGGIYKSVDSGSTWVSRNTGTSSLVADGLNTMQYQGVAAHPTLANYTLGTTQDNGTHLLRQSTGTWVRADSGDGGYSLIDLNSTDEDTNIGLYHDFQNGSGMEGYRYVADSTNPAGGLWFSRGCFGNVPANGINCTDTVNFYAPLALGASIANPVSGNPRQTVYYGTDRLYRSIDQGATHAVVSNAPIVAGVPISAIGVSPQDDNYRVVGLNSGAVYGTTTGATLGTAGTLITGSIPARFVSRAVFNPRNKKQIYVTVTGFGVQHVWRADNFDTGTPTWVSASGTGGGALPDVPVNAFVFDPLNSNVIYVGTDIGVYQSADQGANWAPFGTGLPVVAVFDMVFQNSTHTLRIGTHGRGIWSTLAPTAANTTLSGLVQTGDGSPLGGVTVTLGGGKSAHAITDSNGRYTFSDLEAGGFYNVTPTYANYRFSPSNRSYSLKSDVLDASFAGSPDAVATTNAIDSSDFFVRQQYLDFLDREPDQGGLNYWSGQLEECRGDADCLSARRIGVSAAFFIEQEFQQTGFFIYRMYKGSLGRQPAFAEYLPDRSRIGGSATIEERQKAFAEEWATRAEFRAAYPDSMTSAQFVNKLFDTAGLAGYQAERQNAINALNGGGTRASVIQGMIEDAGFKNRVYNKAFVTMEYFGYLRRDPDQGGLDFWVNVLDNKEQGNFRGMVCSFITSAEYQKRFSSVVTHSNSECK